MTTEHKIAKVLRNVTMRLEHSIETGHRETTFDANDFIETMVLVADLLDPRVPTEAKPPSLLAAACALLDASPSRTLLRKLSLGSKEIFDASLGFHAVWSKVSDKEMSARNSKRALRLRMNHLFVNENR